MDLMPLALAALVGAATAVYAIVGGLDLGVGLLSLLAPRARDRETMLGGLAALWPGNAIWLVLAAFVLASAFPVGTTLLRSLWAPLATMLLALSVRGAAYALRARAGALEGACDAAFGLASGLAILCQGLVLGALLSGVPATGGLLGRDLVLGLLCAAGLAGGYALLGAGWLIRGGDEAVRTFGREVGHAAVILTTGALVLALAWSALAGAAVAVRWSAWPGAVLPLAIAASGLVLGAWAWRGLWSATARATLARAALLVLVVLAGLAASLWPDVAPGAPLERAARSPLALEYTLFDALLTTPILLAYLIHAVRLLRGRPRFDADPRPAPAPHAGRRAASLRNELHLS